MKEELQSSSDEVIELSKDFITKNEILTKQHGNTIELKKL